MRCCFAVFILFICYAGSCSGQDSTKKHHFIVSMYPSNLFVGDISAGFEHGYKKRWSQEIMIFIKCFSPDYYSYKYDHGGRFNYFLKYNFINRKCVRISGNISFAYKHIYFNNKEDIWFRTISYSSNIPAKPQVYFFMDRKIIAYGPGLGLSLNYRLSPKLNIGSDTQLEFLNTQKYFHVKNPDKVDIQYYYPNPNYAPETTYLSPFYTKLTLFLSLKLGYCF